MELEKWDFTPDFNGKSRNNKHEYFAKTIVGSVAVFD